MANSAPAFDLTSATEFHFTSGDVVYVVYKAGWKENGCEVFEIAVEESNAFVDTIYVSPLEEVSEVFEKWVTSK